MESVCGPIFDKIIPTISSLVSLGRGLLFVGFIMTSTLRSLKMVNILVFHCEKFPSSSSGELSIRDFREIDLVVLSSVGDVEGSIEGYWAWSLNSGSLNLAFYHVRKIKDSFQEQTYIQSP